MSGRDWRRFLVMMVDAIEADLRTDLSHLYDSPLHQHQRAAVLERELTAIVEIRAKLQMLDRPAW